MFFQNAIFFIPTLQNARLEKADIAFCKVGYILRCITGEVGFGGQKMYSYTIFVFWIDSKFFLSYYVLEV
jgi:hypothetical protein